MQPNYTVALALAAGFALGAGAIHGLHAAAAPPAYVISEIEVQDEGGYKNDFLSGAQKALDENGGKYIAGGFNKTFSITGRPPANRVVILQFENMDKVKAWRDVARDAQEKIGKKYATFRTFAVEGVTQY
jgi:uncharacterized protein (DUF1330 family)